MSFFRKLIDPPGRGPQLRAPLPAPEDEPDTRWQAIALDTAVGVPTLFLLSAAMLGSVGNAITFFAIAVICTLGFSLLILVPLAWALGALIRRPIVYLLSRLRSVPSAA